MSALDIFSGTPGAYAVYEVAVQVRDLLVGGIPSDPSVTRKWLEARLEAGDARLQEIFEETVAAMQGDNGGVVTMDSKLDALMKSSAAPSANGFKRLPSGELAYEGRCLKGAIKEWANSSYPGNDWDGKYRAPGKTITPGCSPRKGLMSTLAERVFVDPRLIPLGVKEATAVEERIKHLKTPSGPMSALSRVEVIEAPLLEFTIRVRDDFLAWEAWSRIWQTGEEIGIGSDRARSDGRFDLVRFDRVS